MTVFAFAGADDVAPPLRGGRAPLSGDGRAPGPPRRRASPGGDLSAPTVRGGGHVDEGRERSEERSGATAPGDTAPRDGDSPEAEKARGTEAEDSSVTPLAGRIGWTRTVEVDGVRRPVASLLRRGAALAIDICFALLAAGLAIDVLAYFVPVDTAASSGFMLPIFGFLALYIVWLRDRGLRARAAGSDSG